MLPFLQVLGAGVTVHQLVLAVLALHQVCTMKPQPGLPRGLK